MNNDEWKEESASFDDAPKVLRRLAAGRKVFVSVEQHPVIPDAPTKVTTVTGNVRVSVGAAENFIVSAYEWAAKNRGIRVNFKYSARCVFIGGYGL